jgi:hypothetical protein
VSTESPEPEAAHTSSRSSKSKQEQTTKAAETDAPSLPDMPVSQLIEGATAYLGCSSWTAKGALREHEPDEMMSVDAAKAEIEKWRTTPLDKGE